jgi:cytochrome P450
VLESLRYEPSVASFARVTLEDIELDGWTVARQRVLSLSTMSAMRDPAGSGGVRTVKDTRVWWSGALSE